MATKIDKILVTGGAGFIGKHLMQKLGDRGVSYDIAQSDLWDINDPLMLEGVIQAFKPRGIIHLAAISNKEDVEANQELALETNVCGTFNVLQAGKRHKIRVVVASSAATAEPDLSLYGTTKECVESLVRLFDNAIAARLYNVYGSGSKSVVNKFFTRIREEKHVKLNGNTTRDYIYVGDVVDALIDFVSLDVDFPKIIEVGTGRSISLNKLVSILEAVTGKKAKVIHGEAIKEIQDSKCRDTDYLLYKTTLEQGVKNLK